MFEKRVNVGFYLKEIEKNISNADSVSIKVNRYSITKIRKFAADFVKRYSDFIHPKKKAYLLHLIQQCELAEQKLDKKETITNEFGNMKRLLEIYHSYNETYLLRHPEKIERNQKDTRRSLSLNGVLEAKRFGDMILDEVLLCPKQVKVVFRVSNMKRTHLFAQIIMRRINEAIRFHNKKINEQGIKQHPALYDNWTDEMLNEIMPDVNKYGTFYAYAKWKKGQYKLLMDYRPIAAQIQNLILSYPVSAPGPVWSIFINIGHSFNIDTFIDRRLGHHNHIIGTAEFLKFDLGDMYYRGWHNI